jgi:hypothetical protein
MNPSMCAVDPRRLGIPLNTWTTRCLGGFWNLWASELLTKVG